MSIKIGYWSSLRLKDFSLTEGMINPTYCVAFFDPQTVPFLPISNTLQIVKIIED